MISSIKLLTICVFMILSLSALAKKKNKEPDPRECEVCINNLNEIDALIPADKKSDKVAIREAIGKRCTKSGFGSEWKPNPDLKDPKYVPSVTHFMISVYPQCVQLFHNFRDVKMCYYFEPIKEAVSTPFATGMPKQKVCQRLKKENPEICEIKYGNIATISPRARNSINSK